jgi:hypothetical protein
MASLEFYIQKKNASKMTELKGFQTLKKRPYLKKPFTKKRAGGVAQGEGPEFKPQYHEKKKKKNMC